jgi:pyruvate/2-oxoacid:ferredoxin oxidoreductase alpha subunit
MVYSVATRPLAATLRSSRVSSTRYLSTLRPSSTSFARVGVAQAQTAFTSPARSFSISAKAMRGGEGKGEDNVRPPYDQ